MGIFGFLPMLVFFFAWTRLWDFIIESQVRYFNKISFCRKYSNTIKTEICQDMHNLTVLTNKVQLYTITCIISVHYILLFVKV